MYTIRKPVYDFLFNFYGHHLSILYRFQENAGQTFESRTKWQNLTFKGQGHDQFFSIIEAPLSPNGVVWDIARENPFSCLGCTSVGEKKFF